jgi:hypothetical protein
VGVSAYTVASDQGGFRVRSLAKLLASPKVPPWRRYCRPLLVATQTSSPSAVAHSLCEADWCLGLDAYDRTLSCVFDPPGPDRHSFTSSPPAFALSPTLFEYDRRIYLPLLLLTSGLYHSLHCGGISSDSTTILFWPRLPRSDSLEYDSSAIPLRSPFPQPQSHMNQFAT